MNLEDGNKEKTFSKGLVYFGVKKRDSEDWDSNFFNAVLVGEANKKSFDLHDKDTIFITGARVTNKSYKKDGKSRSWLQLTIFDFISGDKEIEAYIESLNKNHESHRTNNTTRSSRSSRK